MNGSIEGQMIIDEEIQQLEASSSSGGLACNDEKLLKECFETLSHAEVFIKNRQKMHLTGRDLYRELIQKLENRLTS